MIDKICDNLTNQIKRKMPEVDEERAEIINYGLHLVIGEIPKFFIFLGIAFLLDAVKEFFLTMLIIFPYRAVSGGFHLKTHLGCIIGTSIMYCGIAYASKFLFIEGNIKYAIIFGVWMFGILMCRLYAPADTENVPILRKKERRTKQILSYVLLTVTLIIGAIIPDKTIMNIIILGMLIQSITITRLAYQLTNNQYGHEIYAKEKIKEVA